jgi:hypothetical protein
VQSCAALWGAALSAQRHQLLPHRVREVYAHLWLAAAVAAGLRCLLPYDGVSMLEGGDSVARSFCWVAVVVQQLSVVVQLEVVHMHSEISVLAEHEIWGSIAPCALDAESAPSVGQTVG